jgi:hypothetical protein
MIRNGHSKSNIIRPNNNDKSRGHNIIMTKTQKSLERQDFTITNVIKGYKVINLTRPNELGTTTSKVATRSPKRT